MQNVFLTPSDYAAFVADLHRRTFCLGVDVDLDTIKLSAGVQLGVWPDTIHADAVANGEA